MNKILNKLVPNIDYENGFKIDGKIHPFYSFSRPVSDEGWTDEMGEFLGEVSGEHFLDVYNRRLAVAGIRDKLRDAGGHYIDVGCSSGYLLEEVARLFPHADIYGADYFSGELVKCHQHLPQVPLFQVDLVNCSFENDLFDAITCLNVLEHIKDDVAALRHLCRILKPGGVLFISVPAAPHLYDIYDEIHCHVRRYGLRELKQKTEDAGLKVLRMNYFASFIYPAFYVAKKINKYRYSKLALADKKRMVYQQAAATQRSGIMEKVCAAEQYIGKYATFPFGIRAYVVATK